ELMAWAAALKWARSAAARDSASPPTSTAARHAMRATQALMVSPDFDARQNRTMNISMTAAGEEMPLPSWFTECDHDRTAEIVDWRGLFGRTCRIACSCRTTRPDRRRTL